MTVNFSSRKTVAVQTEKLDGKSGSSIFHNFQLICKVEQISHGGQTCIQGIEADLEVKESLSMNHRRHASPLRVIKAQLAVKD